MDSEDLLSPFTILAGSLSLVFWYLLIKCRILPNNGTVHTIFFKILKPLLKKVHFELSGLDSSSVWTEFSWPANLSYFTPTPNFTKVPIQKYGKTPNFSDRRHFYFYFQYPSENSETRESNEPCGMCDQQCGMCDLQRLRSACAYVQTDQSLCWSLEYSITVTLLTKQVFEFLSLSRGCTGSSESTLVKMPNCWKSHVTA